MRLWNTSPYLNNWLWSKLGLVQFKRFQKSLEQPEIAQRHYLKQLLLRNTDTKFGHKYHFSDIKSIKDFQQIVPLSDYEDYLPYIENIAGGEKHVLTTDPVLLFQPSSGSTSASKLIPYTSTLKREFQRGIAIWIAALFQQKPELIKGRAYWSLTPPTQVPHRFGCLPVGFDDDAEYLSPLGQWLYRGVSVVPSLISSITDMEVFLDRTLAYLVAASDLTLISVWSPTFLLLLIRRLNERSEEILRLLSDRQVPGLKLGEKRVENIKVAFQHSNSQGLTKALWPNLGLISCWADGPSSLYADDLKRQFAHAEIQGKGLIATEAFVSMPFLPNHDPVLAVDSHLFEFQENESGQVYLTHQLKQGETYSVIVTTGGGFYRYRLKDLVKVTGSIGKTPTLRYVAKENVVDLCGEKLQADHVQRATAAAFAESDICPSFFLLAPVRVGNDGLAYCLFLATDDTNKGQLNRLLTSMQNRLSHNYHYAHCHKIGQLNSLRLFLIDRGSKSPEVVFAKEMQRRGLKLGDIKPSVLDREIGWDNIFPGRFFD